MLRTRRIGRGNLPLFYGRGRHGFFGVDRVWPKLLLISGFAAAHFICPASSDSKGSFAESFTGFVRIVYLFDGNDTDAVKVARAQWTAAKSAGCAVFGSSRVQALRSLSSR